MNYLFFTEYFPESERAEFTGGVENRVFYIAKRLSKSNDVTVICSRQKGQKKYSKVDKVKVVRPGPINAYSQKGNILSRFFFAVSAYIEGIKYKSDFVEGCSFIVYIPAFFVGKRIESKKVATWHETWIGEWVKNKGLITGMFGEVWERISIRLDWDEIVCVSNFTKERLIKKGVKCKRIRVVPNGIELNKIRKIKARKFERPTVCVVGRLTKQKNVDLIINGVALIKKELPRVQLKVVGKGPEYENLKRLVKKKGLERDVEFLGFLPKHSDVIRTLKASHLYVSASELEGFGITVLEAMAAKLPCLLSRIQAFEEVTQKNAVFFDNKEEFAKKAINLLRNRKRYINQINRQDNIVKEYDWERIIERITKKWLS